MPARLGDRVMDLHAQPREQDQRSNTARSPASGAAGQTRDRGACRAFTRKEKGGPEGPPCQSYPDRPVVKSCPDRCGTRSGGSRNLYQPALVQDFGDLHRVGRGALEQVVADDPHLQAALVRGVAAQAADEDLVAARAGSAVG